MGDSSTHFLKVVSRAQPPVAPESSVAPDYPQTREKQSGANPSSALPVNVPQSAPWSLGREQSAVCSFCAAIAILEVETASGVDKTVGSAVFQPILRCDCAAGK